MLQQCPSCLGSSFAECISVDEVALETALRGRFMQKRTNGNPDGEALKDRTDFAHGRDVAILECRTCGLLVRDDLDEDFSEVYANDTYDAETLGHFLQRDIRFFRRKRDPYQSLLPHQARVIELGSYAGGFLHVAREWGWRVEGIDIGEDVTRFANENGYPTRLGTLAECGYPAHSIDGVFIWNCFDQLTDPNGTLAEAGRILKPGGLLVLRAPNALFYRLSRPLLQFARQSDPPDLAETTIGKVMGYNNLLGFPYQFGYAPPNLRRMAERHGFAVERLMPSNLLMLPDAEAPDWAIREQRETMNLLSSIAEAVSSIHHDIVAGPWFELIARRR